MSTYLGARLARALMAGALLLAAPANSCSSIGSPGIGIVVELEFSPPISVQEASAIQAEFDAPSAYEAPTTVRCDHDYAWRNAVGTYHVQRACGSSSAPWSLVLSQDAQAIVVGDANERGMDWTVDGKKQGRQAPHTEWPGYIWHGTYNGLQDGSKVTYEDQVSFEHIYGGNATVTLSGTHRFSDQPW